MSGDKHPARSDDSNAGEQPSSPERDRTVRDRMEDGRRCLQAIGGPDYDGPLKKVAEVSPDMADLLLAFPYGDVMSRPGLSLRDRQICTVAMLLAHRSAQAQLRFHMRGLLNVGGSIDDLVELLVIASGLLGFPTALNAFGVAGKVFAGSAVPERGAPAPGFISRAEPFDRTERGLATLEATSGGSGDAVVKSFAGVVPSLVLHGPPLRNRSRDAALRRGEAVGDSSSGLFQALVSVQGRSQYFGRATVIRKKLSR